MWIIFWKISVYECASSFWVSVSIDVGSGVEVEVAVVERIKFIHLAFFPATHKGWDSKENKRELKAETSEFNCREPNELK